METEKKTPEEEKKPAPAPEQKDEPKPEEKPADNKQTDDNGTADKPDESKAEDKKDEKPEEKVDKPESEPAPAAPTVPDAKDEEILRLKTQIAAMSLGVKPDCMDDAVAIAESYVKSGKSEDINLALSAVVKKYPDMKADVGEGKKQGGFKVGAGSSDKEEKPAENKQTDDNGTADKPDESKAEVNAALKFTLRSTPLTELEDVTAAA